MLSAMWRRLLKLLYYLALSLYLVSIATLIAILWTAEWHPELMRLSNRVWIAFLVHVGSTGAGFISPVILSVLSVVLTMVCIGVLQGRAAMVRHWWETALITVVVLVTTMLAVYGPQFIWQVIKLTREDHRTIAESNQQLIAENKDLHSKLSGALTNAERQCEQNKGTEIRRLKSRLNGACYRPDRHLTKEDRAVIFAALQKITDEQKKQGTVPSIRLMCFGGDLESCNFQSELWPIFRNAGWTMRTEAPSEQSKKNFEAQRAWLLQKGHFEGVTVFDKDQKGWGWALSIPFYERGFGEMWTPRPDHTELPGVDGLTIWVGYKPTR
jgi:hypothetical protein